ncbi:MAG TPA: sugar ABC transporter ATP-binding protein [Pelolinea sp.]|nr:sugar ABC transporter ATP-binding protein [Pelolinea sp.]
MAEKLLRVEHITKHFAGVTALDDVSFSVDQGESMCLVGENGSGKSTMIKIISGVYTADSGDIFINGNHYKKLTPMESMHAGVQVIYQDFSLFPNLTVAENISISELLSTGKKMVNWKEVKELAQEGLDKIRVSIPLDAIAGTLSTADRQLIAITKAILADARLIIMDEPTTALTRREVEALFKIINDLNNQGVATIFVSHKLNEVRQISQRTVILRNGKKVLDQDAKDLDIKTIEYQMTGREINTSSIKYSKSDTKSAPLLKVENLHLLHGFFDLSFELYKNEVLGITGLLGSGRTELALSLFGQLPADSGKIYLEGKKIRIRNIFDATSRGFGYVPEDRIREGLFLPQSITDNIAVSIIDTLTTVSIFLDKKAKKQLSDNWIEKLNVKTPSGKLPAKSLSGGNQQRLVLAKWLAQNPKILILNGPTVGVDVGSKSEIHELVLTLARQGMGILMISDDIPELMQTCNRILLMRRGKIVNEFIREKTTEEELAKELVATDSNNH